MFNILIRGGKIVDGTGNPWFPGDVGVSGDRIAAVGNLSGAEGEVEIDARGKVVCPGFVDCHSHSDGTILANREGISSIYQGVTTEIVGSCGYSSAPIADRSRSLIKTRSLDEVNADWSTVGEYLDRLREGIAINLGFQVGHHMIRSAAMNDAEAPVPSEAEMQEMERLVAESLDAGAVGLSFGLEFLPGRMAGAEELERLCAVAGSRKKMTSWHVRNRDRHFEEAVNEAIAVTKAAGAGLQLSHLSSKPGSSPRSWNRCMEAVRLAREEGHDVQCDMIPYTVGPGLMRTILPDWAMVGSEEDVIARLRDPAVRQKLIADSERYWFLFSQREWDKLALARSRAHPEWLGLTFREIGKLAGKDPFDCVYDILADEGGDLHVGVTGVLFSEGDIAEWLSDPLFSIASDGKTSKDSGATASAGHHPTSYGWAPRVIQKYVHEERVLGLEEAIRKMTSMPAARFFTNRGLIRPHMMADLIVFDETEFRTRATYLKPQVYAEGMDCVIVNGRLALEKATPTGVLSGRVLAN